MKSLREVNWSIEVVLDRRDVRIMKLGSYAPTGKFVLSEPYPSVALGFFRLRSINMNLYVENMTFWFVLLLFSRADLFSALHSRRCAVKLTPKKISKL